MEIKNLTKTFDKRTVIDSLSLTLPERGTVAFMGPSGCGKTTLLRIIAGLEKANSGKVSAGSKTVSYAFQEPRLFPWLSAKDNIKTSTDDEKNASEWLSKVELADDADKFPHELSGGMQQRISLARALSKKADIYILDEPFTGLDEDLKNRLYDLVRGVAKDALVLIVTHDRDEARALADEIITFEGTPAKTYTQTKNRE